MGHKKCYVGTALLTAGKCYFSETMERLVVKMPFLPGKRASQRQKDAKKELKSKDPTGAQRQKCFRDKRKNDEMYREKNRAKCASYRLQVKELRDRDENQDKIHRRRERERKAAYRRKKREEELDKKRIQIPQNTETENSQNDQASCYKKKMNSSRVTKTTSTPDDVAQLKRKIRQYQQGKRRLSRKICMGSTRAVHDATSTMRKRAQRVRKSLPQSPKKWAETVHHLTRNASPQKKTALNQLQKKNSCRRRNVPTRQFWRENICQFLSKDNISRQMPNKRDVIKVDGSHVAKRHLCCSKKEAFLHFVEQNPSYPYRYTTFRKSIPKFITKMNLNDRRICVCMKCFNATEKLRAVSRVAASCNLAPLTTQSVYKDSVCKNEPKGFPKLACVEEDCTECSNFLQDKYADMLEQEGNTTLKYAQWEHVDTQYMNSKGQKITTKCWKQVDHTKSLETVFTEINEGMKDLKGHLFRNDYQYSAHQSLIKSLPLDQAVVFGDFSQNYALAPNDEIESAHYNTPQVTIHTWYLLRHTSTSTLQSPQLTKESIVMISDDLKHDTSAVFNFTKKLLAYMRNNPQRVGLPRILHRITDNCGFEYKCRQAFADLMHIEQQTGVKVVYHFAEPGHGKGPHDGIGATIKHGLDTLILHDKVRLRNAYEVYLATTTHFSEVGLHAEPSRKKTFEFSSRAIMYVPAKVTRSGHKDTDVKQVKGTMKLRFIHSISPREVEFANLSCSCPTCLFNSESECSFKEWRKGSTCALWANSTQHPDAASDIDVDVSGQTTHTLSGNQSPADASDRCILLFRLHCI